MDLYVVLGLSHGATESEIKRAYRRLARRFHPDINPGDRAAEVRFRQILSAYETLIDPERRTRYDAGAPAGDSEGQRGSGFEGFDFSARGSDYAVTFGDLVAEVLTGRNAAPRASGRGADLHQEVRVSVEGAFAGTECPVTGTSREACRACDGTGRTRVGPGTCQVCQGTGAVRSVRGHMVFSRSCGACGGTGRSRPRGCEPCGGTGHEVHTEIVRVQIPAGVADSDRIRVAGRGDAGAPGEPPGDLYITVHVEEHPVFRREGDDVHLVVPIAIHEAALGARLDVLTPDGPARLRVPPGTQSGQRFRLRERGMTSARGGRRGDLVAEVRLMLPRVLDERSKELLREFGRLNGENVRDRLQEETRHTGSGSRREQT